MAEDVPLLEGDVRGRRGRARGGPHLSDFDKANLFSAYDRERRRSGRFLASRVVGKIS